MLDTYEINFGFDSWSNIILRGKMRLYWKGKIKKIKKKLHQENEGKENKKAEKQKVLTNKEITTPHTQWLPYSFLKIMFNENPIKEKIKDKFKISIWDLELSLKILAFLSNHKAPTNDTR